MCFDYLSPVDMRLRRDDDTPFGNARQACRLRNTFSCVKAASVRRVMTKVFRRFKRISHRYKFVKLSARFSMRCYIFRTLVYCIQSALCYFIAAFNNHENSNMEAITNLHLKRNRMRRNRKRDAWSAQVSSCHVMLQDRPQPTR